MRTRPAGLKLVIAYKLLKAPAMLALALALTVSPARIAHAAVHELSELGHLGWRAAVWVEPHLTPRNERRTAALAWLDGATTLAEGVLLLTGTAWGEWIVVASLGALLPFEAYALVRRPGSGRAVVLLINAAVVAYLARRRLRSATDAARLPREQAAGR